MKITILNPVCSQINEETESKMLWTSLLLADEIYYAAKGASIIALRNIFTELPEKLKYTAFEHLARKLFSQEEVLDLLKKYLAWYHKYRSIKHKNKDQLLLFLEAKRGLDKLLSGVQENVNSLCKKYNFYELLPFVNKKLDCTIYPLPLIFHPRTPEEINKKITVLTDYLLLKGNMFLLGAEVFKALPAIKFGKVPEKFNKIDVPHFIYGEFIDLPSLESLSYDHFNVLRNIFLKEVEPILYVFKELEGAVQCASYLIETIKLIEQFYGANKNVIGFITDELNKNQFLNNLICNGTVKGNNRIYYAMTSKEFMIDIFQKLSFIDERDKLYLIQNLSSHIDVKTICQFFIFEEVKQNERKV